MSDRYEAMGIPYPDPETMCLGQCEGTGYVPVKLAYENNPGLIELWHEAERKEPTDDGWHLVVCPDCNGTRIRVTEEEMKAREKEISEELSASEALCAFMGWLTSREEKSVFSATDGAKEAADLVGIFCKTNKLSPPRCDWTDRFKMPPNC